MDEIFKRELSEIMQIIVDKIQAEPELTVEERIEFVNQLVEAVEMYLEDKECGSNFSN